jgi:biopolymer transport protein ExbD
MPLKTNLDEQPTLNLTPMIDIVFLLIIFFMAGTQFTQLERKIALQVPEVSSNDALSPAPDKRLINVFEDGRIELDHNFVSAAELTARLRAARAQYADLGVVVRGDADARHQNVTEVLNACRAAGVGKLGVSVRVARKPSRVTN